VLEAAGQVLDKKEKDAERAIGRMIEAAPGAIGASECRAGRRSLSRRFL
jgi:hypothetical protein